MHSQRLYMLTDQQSKTLETVSKKMAEETLPFTKINKTGSKVLKYFCYLV